jgi:SAM-dependent methyltransferase
VRLICGDYEHLDQLLKPEELNSFDLVWAFGSIHHTASPANAMRQAWGALKSGGQIRCMVYSKISWKRFDLLHRLGPWSPARSGDGTVCHNSEAVQGSPITFTYSLSEAAALAMQAGFEVVDISKAHIFRYEIVAYQQGKYEPEEIWKNVSKEDLQDLEAELGWHTLIKAIKP